MPEDPSSRSHLARPGAQRHIFIATPCYGGMVTQTYMQSVLALMAEPRMSDVEISIALLGQDALITRSRNTLVAQFMRSTASDMLFIDADIGFTPSDVLRLVRAGKDVVGGVYPIRSNRWNKQSVARVQSGEAFETAALDYVGEPIGEPDPNGLIRASFAGTGFLLISRRALDRLIASYPETSCRHAHVATSTLPVEIFALFDCLIEPNTRNYLSEDYAFCSRWRAIGGEIWLDTRLKLSHCGMSEFAGDPALRFSKDVDRSDPT